MNNYNIVEKLYNLRTALHMFVYPNNIEILINKITSRFPAAYIQMENSVTIKLGTTEPLLQVQNTILEIFNEFLQDDTVVAALQFNITPESFMDYKELIHINQNFKFLFNMTVISATPTVNQEYIIKL